MFKLYKKFLKPYRLNVIFGPICKVIEAIFELLVPLVIKTMIDVGVNKNFNQVDYFSSILLKMFNVGDSLTNAEAKSFLIKCGLLLFSFACIGLFFTIICQYVASVASQGFGTLLRNDLYKHINTLSFKELDTISESKLMTRITVDINNVEKSVAMLIRLVIRAPLIVIGSTILSFSVSYKAGFIFLGASIILSLITYFIMHYTVPINKTIQGKLDTVTKITKENLEGNRVVRAFLKEDHETKRFKNSQEELKDYQIRAGRINVLMSPLTFLVVSLASILVIFVGGKEFLNGVLTQGEIQALINYFVQIQVAIIAVSNLVVVFNKAIASSKRINDLFEIKNMQVFGNEEVEYIDEAITFSNVTFKYNDNTNPVLKNMSFSIKRHENIGIIGSTGSGKTTMSHLINRFYDANEGSILLYGKDIKSYSKDSLNKLVSTAMQHAVLFNGTIMDNLKSACNNLSDEKAKETLKISQAYEFVSKLKDGLNTKVLQSGSNFSGGQRQRLSIARALAKDSDILILDDSSSALDFKTEKNLRQSIKGLDKTLIVISQRASSVMHMDRIIVLDNGEIEAIGSHNELLEKSSVYKEICHSQDVGAI
jgi:ATP-binding cassette subfamily B protein